MTTVFKTNFASVLPKTCIVVGGEYPHVRNYKKEIKGRMNNIEAVFKAHYAKPVLAFKSFV